MLTSLNYVLIKLYYFYQLYFTGSENVGSKVMQDFITSHKKLRFLGLMHMDDCGLAMFTVPTHPLYNPDLVVSIIS